MGERALQVCASLLQARNNQPCYVLVHSDVRQRAWAEHGEHGFQMARDRVEVGGRRLGAVLLFGAPAASSDSLSEEDRQSRVAHSCHRFPQHGQHDANLPDLHHALLIAFISIDTISIVIVSSI